MKRLKRFLVLFFLLFLPACNTQANTPQAQNSFESSHDDSRLILDAYQKRLSRVTVVSSGIIEKVLPDDTKGIPHQRFVVRLSNNHTLLIAHNLDLAPRINNLKAGKKIKFRGQYEWSDKGGTVHLTHHDPSYRRLGGWIEYEGNRYE